MAEKLTPEKIEEIAKNYEKITEGKLPIIKGEKEEIKIDPKLLQEKKKILRMIPPSDPRLLMQIAPFVDDTLKEAGFKDRVELSKTMYDTMVKYGGIGLSANQVGKPYRLFVMGDNLQINKGQKWVCINPEITGISKETIRYKEGCLTFPFLFLDIERPQKVKVKYQNEQLETVEEEFDGIVSRCYQHELDHMHGRVFTELVSKLKLNMALKKRDKEIKRVTRLYEKKNT